jgi:hypothetical protein
MNERVIGEWIGKDVEGSGRGLIVRFYPGIFLGELMKTKDNTRNQDSWSADRYLKPETPEFEVGALTTRPRRSVCKAVL